MILLHIIWWIACASLVFGLILALFMALVFMYSLVISGPSDSNADLEGPSSIPLFLFLESLLLVPASCVLLLLWSLNLAPEPFSSIELPGYYIVGRAVTWITIAILCAGPIWATVATIGAIRRRFGNHSKR